MLGRKDMNLSFDDQWLANKIPEDSYWHRIRVWTDENLNEKDFEHLFSQYGRPSVSPLITFPAILIQLEKGYSDRELEGESRFDDRVKYALGTGRNFEGIDAVTLHDHRKRFFESEVGIQIFLKTLGSAKEAGLFSEENIHVVDSFMVLGRAAKQDTYTLIYQSIKMALTIADYYELEIREILTRDDYEDDCNKPRINWEDEDEKQELLTELVQDALKLVAFLREQKPFTEELKCICNLLERVATQDVNIDDDGDVKLFHGTCKDRVISVNDPEMRHGRQSRSKKNDGYKTEILTGGPQADIVIGMATEAANVPDGTHLDELIDFANDAGIKTDEILGDSKYTNWEVIESREKEGINICTKTSTPINRHATFTKDDFKIDLEVGQVACPGGKSASFAPSRIKDERKHTIVKFKAEDCNSCPLKEKCTTSENGRSVTVHAYEDRLQEQREYQKTEEYHEKYSRRANGERTIAHLTRHGARLGRFFGKCKTQFQQRMVAINHNIKMVMKYILQPA